MHKTLITAVMAIATLSSSFAGAQPMQGPPGQQGRQGPPGQQGRKSPQASGTAGPSVSPAATLASHPATAANA